MAESLGPRMTETIVAGSLLGIAQDLIGLVDLLELLLSHTVPVTVGMVLESHPTIGFLYFFIRCPPTHAEDLVVVAFGDHDVNNYYTAFDSAEQVYVPEWQLDQHRIF